MEPTREKLPVPAHQADAWSNLVAQTAELRFSIRYEGQRRLLRQRGYDPSHCFQFSCDHGDHVRLGLVLADGTIAVVDFAEDSHTRQATHINRWDVETFTDLETNLASEILRGKHPHFDAEVRAYYESEIAPSDCPLPPDRVLAYITPPPGLATIPWQALVALLLAVAAPATMCLCGHMSWISLAFTLPAAALAWSAKIRRIRWSLAGVILVLITAFASLELLKNVADVLWFDHEALFR